jgi:hypothetical protein
LIYSSFFGSAEFLRTTQIIHRATNNVFRDKKWGDQAFLKVKYQPRAIIIVAIVTVWMPLL